MSQFSNLSAHTTLDWYLKVTNVCLITVSLSVEEHLGDILTHSLWQHNLVICQLNYYNFHRKCFLPTEAHELKPLLPPGEAIEK